MRQAISPRTPFVRTAAVIVLSWWVVFTGGISHALDVSVDGPYSSRDQCDQAARAYNQRGRTPQGYQMLYGQYYFCEWLNR
jgi:hypothetical protein